MAQQSFKRLALAAALVSLGVGMTAWGQSSTTATPSSGTSAGSSKSGSASGANSGSSSASGGAASTGSTSSSKSGKSALDSSERKFIENAAKDGMAEVELGQIASQKGQSQQVKEFGTRMTQDHGKANDELKTLASSKGVQLPSDTDKSHKKKADELNKKSADKFDHEYMELMVKEHKKDVKDFEKMSKNAKDADVRAFAAKTLPTLQEHLKMAQNTEDSVKKSGKSGGKTASSGSSSGGGAAHSGSTAASGGSASGSSGSSMGSGGAPSGSTGATGAKTK